MPQSDPVQEHVAPGVPQGLPVVGVPVEVVDVLVALGRVLGVLERAVGALLEPLGVLGQPRVVGGRVERDVQRDVHPVLVGGGAQVADVLLGAELGVDGEVAALGAADRVRRAGIVGAGGERVVAALALVDADRVERQQVEDVEAEVGDVRDELLDGLDAAPGAREQLVPGGEAGLDAVHLDRDRLLERAAPSRSWASSIAWKSSGPSATSNLSLIVASVSRTPIASLDRALRVALGASRARA